MTHSATLLDFPNILQGNLCCLAKVSSDVTGRSSSMHFFYCLLGFISMKKICLMEPGCSLGIFPPLSYVIAHIKKKKPE